VVDATRRNASAAVPSHQRAGSADTADTLDYATMAHVVDGVANAVLGIG
jgi:hypothetical protein